MGRGPHIIVIGTSAGGLAALRTLLVGIPEDINAAIFVVQHTAADSPNRLPTLLQPVTRLEVASAKNREVVKRGRIYLAPPDHHLILADGHVLTTKGPKENYSRPSIDPLFRSAALIYGPQAIGVILTGTLDDGSSGLWAVKERGGVAIVQEPEDAEFSQMPRNALSQVRVDYCLPVADIGPLLGRLAELESREAGESAMSKDLKLEVRVAKGEQVSKREMLELGDPSIFGCPECHGALLQLKRSKNLRFRCHTGHAFSGLTLLSHLNAEIEGNLWTTIRSMEEAVLLLDHLAKHMQTISKGRRFAKVFNSSSQNVEARAATLRRLVMENEALPLEELEDIEPIDANTANTPIPQD